MTAVLGESALFTPGYEYFSAIPHSPVAPRGFDRRVEGIRPTQTAFLGGGSLLYLHPLPAHKT